MDGMTGVIVRERCAGCNHGVRAEIAPEAQIWKSRTTSLRADLGRRSRYFSFGGSALTWFSGGTLLVMNTLPPITAPLPMTVSPPRIVAPA